MNKLRWLGLMLLLTLLLAPYEFTGNANQLNGFESEQDELSIYGNVTIRGTPSGHVTVAVDRSFPMRGIQADGVPDIAFHFVPRKLDALLRHAAKNRHEYQAPAVELEGGTVAFTSKRVTVLSADRHILMNVSLENRPKTTDRGVYYEDVTRDQLETVRLYRGKALVAYRGHDSNIERLWVCGAAGGKCAVWERTGEMRIADDFELENPCPGGGRGASSCTVSCGGGQGCSVTCNVGYYACCHCSNGCHCVAN